MILPCGTTLCSGKYEIICVLSHGGFGITYKAVRKTDNMIVCIKEFFIDYICQRNSFTNAVFVSDCDNELIFNKYKKLFFKESQTLKALRHPNIVSIYETFEENGTAYYSMRFIEGKTINELIPNGGLSLSECINYMQQLCSALTYMHSHYIAHLDIKPANILIDGNNQAILIDFGGAKRYTECGVETSISPSSTSNGYSPIELYEDKCSAEFTPKTDIYSLGATLYYMLTSQNPPSAWEVIESGVPVYKISASIPKAVGSVIVKAMSPLREDRFQDIESFLHALQQASIVCETILLNGRDDETILLNGKSDETILLNGKSDETILLNERGDETILLNGKSDETILLNGRGDETILFNGKGDETISNYNAEFDTNRSSNTSRNKYWLIVAFFVVSAIAIFVIWLNRDHSAQENTQQENTQYELDTIAQPDNELSNFAESENIKCPKTLLADLGFCMDSILFRNHNLVYYISIGPQGKTVFDELNRSEEARKTYIKTGLRSDKRLFYYCQLLTEIGGSLTYVFHFGDKTLETTLSSKDLASIEPSSSESSVSNYEKYSTMAENCASLCPQIVDEGLTMIDCQYKNKTVKYIYECTSDYYSYIKNNQTSWKADLKRQLNDDPSTRLLVKQFSKDGVNIEYIYKRKKSKDSIILIYNPTNNEFI